MTTIHVVAGVGGAGKTTVSAAMATAFARAGQRAVVLTIDPARRLADALGIPHLGNEPTPIDVPGLPEGGRLDALMLDRKATWDGMVREHAPSPDLADRLIANPYYDAVSTRLTGGHEWMAIEKLHRLVQADRWDVVVVDTPPAQHALDFLDAPERIRRMLDGRVIRGVLSPRGGLLGLATKGAVDAVRRLAGPDVLDDLQGFFSLVGDLGDGFRERGGGVHALLHSAATRYWLVAPADGPRTSELVAFRDALRQQHLEVAGVLLNRFVPPLGQDLMHLHAVVQDAAVDSDPATSEAVTAWIHDRIDARHTQALRHAACRDTVGQALGCVPHPLPDAPHGIHDVHGLIALALSLPTGLTQRTQGTQ